MTSTERAERIRAHEGAKEQTQRMLDVFADEQPEILEFIANDVQQGIAQWPNLELTILQDQGEGDGSCSVAGVYLGQFDPKVIGVARASSARMRFTGLHELGHHIQRSNDDLLEALLDRPDQGRILEEAACDLFAARLLLPQHDIDTQLGNTTPSALNVLELWQSHNASRAAAAVAAVQKLSTDGHVLIISSEGTVEFAASRGLPRVRRGSDQSATAFGRAISTSTQRRVQGRTRLTYRDSIQGEELYFQAINDGSDYWFVVAATSSVPWEQIALPIPDARTIQGYWWTCELCGHSWESFTPKHQPCGTPVCLECNRCGCRITALKPRICESCFLEKSPNEFVGDSRICIEC